ncbi:GGDEF domain-containing protein [Acidipila rosea]|uniref:diguanylate cyclase n=1 Tax=Acidipila rosea TaxID=768535 RepID=A0A4R1L281_9BACT|nr:GGDEF domain-containing protein [Acidipila rosea]MBW4027891.1 GGDEF domain-containing protein [Acidobacteriota bacterium]MBW4045264.1 GGDEF domain-containing protein [Acidobacteriota bacterium]TCK72102.1 diguanylate cyclase (GGDEF)-like protein [Acidipila rosea]
MNLVYPNTIRKRSSAVMLVILAALGSAAFICAGSVLVYSSARQLIVRRDLEDHSNDVLSALQLISRRIGDIDLTIRLYQKTSSDGDLKNVQRTAAQLEAASIQLQNLVADDVSQQKRANRIVGAAHALNESLEDLDAKSSFPVHQLMLAREALSQMEVYEQALLAARKRQAREQSYRSLGTAIAYVLLSLAVVLMLFGSLLRDILRRKQFEDQLSRANSQLELTIGQLESRAREAALLTAARDEMQLCISPSDAHTCAARYCERLLTGTRGGVLVINNSRQMVELRASWGDPEALIDCFALDSCCGLRSGRARWRKDGQSEVHCTHFNGEQPENYLCIPLAAQGDTLGFVYVECPNRRMATIVESQEAALQELVETASMAIAGLNLRMRLENQSIRDGLTNLFNRHFMEIALEREILRAGRSRNSLAVFMLDVDHFKQFNDTYGHEAGDNVLREVAETFRQCVRAEDIICRYGGEEFVIILPEITTSEAWERAEAVRRKVGEIRVRHRGESLREVTISLGLAMYPADADTLEELLREADRALYDAKHRGRNCVVTAQSRVNA